MVSQKKLKIFGVLVLLVVTCIWALQHTNNREERVIATRSVMVVAGEVTSSFKAFGSVRASRQVDLGSQTSGQIRKVNVHIGQSVRHGQILAEIDPTQLKLDLATAQLALNRTQLVLQARRMDLAFASRQLEHESRLLLEEAIGRDAVEKTRKGVADFDNAVKQAEIEFSKAKLDLDIAADKVTKATILAPFDGVIIDLPAQEGQTLNASQQTPTVLRMAVLDTVVLRILVPEVDISRVFIGQPVTFTSFATGSTKFDAKVENIHPIPEKVGNAVFFVVYVRVPNHTRKLWPEMTIDVTFIEGIGKGMLIPIEFLGARNPDGRYRVLVQKGQGNVIERTIQTGMSDGERICVVNGLSIGEQVVIKQLPTAERR